MFLDSSNFVPLTCMAATLRAIFSYEYIGKTFENLLVKNYRANLEIIWRKWSLDQHPVKPLIRFDSLLAKLINFHCQSPLAKLIKFH